MADTPPDVRTIHGVLDLNCRQMDVDAEPKRLQNVKDLVQKLGLSKLNVSCNDKLTDKAAELFIDYNTDPVAKNLLSQLERYRDGIGTTNDAMRYSTLSGQWQSRTDAIKSEFSIFVRRQHTEEKPAPVATKTNEPLWQSLVAELRAILYSTRKPPEVKPATKLPSLIETIVANNPALQDKSVGDAYMPFIIRDIRERNAGVSK